ncbi:MAG: adenylate/guanylate cyclase domain-containing protein [Leptospiraceae bacterium]|nr:adenylate/guanylate cyclase domain-containing protein [Leptospiraceae bacterium]
MRNLISKFNKKTIPIKKTSLLAILEERYKISEDIVISEIEFSILKSEKFRILIIIILVMFGILHFLSLKFFSPKGIVELLGKDRLIYLHLLILTFYLIYEGFLYFRVNTLIQKRMRISNVLRYLNAFIEISAPTIFLYILVININSVEALIFSPYLIYFLIIILSILRLDIALSIFTGFIAFIQYFLLSLYFMFQFKNMTNIPIYLLSWEFYFTNGMIILVAGILSGVISNLLKSYIKHSAKILEDRNEIMNIFGQYVSPEVMDKLIHQKNLDLTEKKQVSVMFLDIRNFTSFSESKDPVEVIDFLNELFEPMVEIINQYQGIINKFLGDGFIAIFGAPVELENSAWHAYKAAIEILQYLERLKSENTTSEKFKNIRIGIGIHTGVVVTGNVGSKTRKEYTVIGETVNLASRIEQINKKFQSQLILSKETYDEILKKEPNISYQEIKKVIVKGKTQPVIIYKII